MLDRISQGKNEDESKAIAKYGKFFMQEYQNFVKLLINLQVFIQRP